MSEQKKTLYIHAGVPKTGSTAIQHFLNVNREKLFSDGYIFRTMKLYDYDRSTRLENESGEQTVVESHRFNPKLRNGFFLHGSSEDPYEENLKRLNKGLGIILKWMDEKPNVILTDEVICRECFNWDFLSVVKEFSCKNNIDVKIIIFLRRQDDFLDSFYRQTVKQRFLTDDWDTYLSKNAHSDAPPTNYERVLDRFTEAFGRDSITVIPYEPALWSENGLSIFSIFMDCLGISDQSGYRLPPRSANESTTYGQTEIMRILNRLTEAGEPLKVQSKNFFKKTALECSELKKDDKRLSYFSDEERKKLLSEFAEENQRIAETYLDRKELFISEVRPGDKWEYDTVRMQEEMILYFGYVTKQLHEEVQYLKEHSLSVYAIHIKFHRIKKKLLNFFRK